MIPWYSTQYVRTVIADFLSYYRVRSLKQIQSCNSEKDVPIIIHTITWKNYKFENLWSAVAVFRISNFQIMKRSSKSASKNASNKLRLVYASEEWLKAGPLFRAARTICSEQESQLTLVYFSGAEVVGAGVKAWSWGQMFPPASHRLSECNDSEQTNLFSLSIVLPLADTTI